MDPRNEQPVFVRRRERGISLADLTSRELLIEAGWRESDRADLGRGFAGITTARAAKAAGVTTGSFFHHFSNAADFADAMVRSFAPAMPVRESDESQTMARGDLVNIGNLLRTNLRLVWESATTDPDTQIRLRSEMRLWSYHHQLLPNPDEQFSRVADVMKAGYIKRDYDAAQVWAMAMGNSGREFRPPYTIQLVATAVSALLEGLLLRAAVAPEMVPPNLFGEISAALVEAVTGPAGARATLGESSVDLTEVTPRSPQARSGARRRHETRRRIVDASIGIFGDGWESVSASDIAERADVSAPTVINLFRSVRGVAAATFAAHANEMYASALARPREDPRRGLHSSLIDLTLRVRADPEAARALLAEQIVSQLNRGQSLGDMDVRLEVPVTGAIGLWIGRMGIPGGRGLDIATMIVNFVLSNALTSSYPPDEIVELAIRLLPETAPAADTTR